jgi:dihydropteroate synthase
MFSLNCRGKLVFAENPLIMGILNLTEDSFYAGSRHHTLEGIKEKTAQMLSEGADIIDLGAQSTRPGSTRFTAEDELEKLLPAIDCLVKDFPSILISIDTYFSKVARECVAAGACIINDISGGNMDSEMIQTVGKLHVPYVCMHMKGVPETMQNQAQYEDVTKEVLDYFIAKIEECKQAGIHDVIIDPGFGFGKNITQNFKILKDLSVFKILEKPLMVGVSRKSTIYRTLKISAEDALNGTTVLHTIALQNGASILRVHDVKEAKEVVTLLGAISKA